MKKMKEVISNSSIPASLVRAVVKRLGGMQYAQQIMEDVSRNGADMGVIGFVCYGDCLDFFKKHKKAIIEMAENMAIEIGDGNAIEMISQFRCIKQWNVSNIDICRTLYGDKRNGHVVTALAWFALEEVSRAFCDE